MKFAIIKDKPYLYADGNCYPVRVDAVSVECDPSGEFEYEDPGRLYSFAEIKAKFGLTATKKKRDLPTEPIKYIPDNFVTSIVVSAKGRKKNDESTE